MSIVPWCESEFNDLHKSFCDGDIEWAGNHTTGTGIFNEDPGMTFDCKKCGSGYWTEIKSYGLPKEKQKRYAYFIHGPIRERWLKKLEVMGE